MILVSACLVGINCKYSGENNFNEGVVEFLKGKDFIPFCPEQMGGLTTPRPAVELRKGRAVTAQGDDVTENFTRGVEETLRLVKLIPCSLAILKEGSPSCGSSYIYDGTFEQRTIPGEGMVTALLRDQGIPVVSEVTLKDADLPQ